MGQAGSTSIHASAYVGEQSVASSIGSTKRGRRVVRQMVAPMTGQYDPSRYDGPPSEEASLRTKDGKLVNSRLVLPTQEPQIRRAVLLFHGNGMTMDGMGPFANMYFDHDPSLTILMITLRGYMGSEGGDGSVEEDGESGMYLDVAVAVDVLLELGIERCNIVAHGFSLGGSMAAAAAVQHGLGALVLDHTFTSAKDVAGHIAAEHTSFPAWLARGAMGGGFRAGTNVRLGGGRVVQTDGLASVSKVARFQGALVVVYGTQDHLMPVSFADSFVQAYRGPHATRVEIEGGGHDCRWIYTMPDKVKEVINGTRPEWVHLGR